MRIAYVLGEYPSDSEYFVQQEISQWRKKGVNIGIYALKKGGKKNTDSANNSITYYKLFSLEYIIGYAWYLFFKPRLLCKALVRAFTPYNSLSILGSNLKALHAAVFFGYKMRGSGFDWIHAHFISYPASIAHWMSCLTQIPFSISAHANDIYSGKLLYEKILASQFVVTCNAHNKRYLIRHLHLDEELACKIHVVYHGINLDVWQRKKKAPLLDSHCVRILSIGRLIEKKGQKYLLEAIKMLVNEGLKVHCTIVGEGPLLKTFQSYVVENGLTKNILFTGAQSQPEIRNHFESADIFILPCVVTSTGDRDGLPNVILESLAMEVPVITTDVAGIGELVRSRQTGLLVAQRDSFALCETIKDLISSSEMYTSLRKNGRQAVEAFNVELATARLTQIFGV